MDLESVAPSEATGELAQNHQYLRKKELYLEEYLKMKSSAVKQIKDKYEPELKELKS